MGEGGEGGERGGRGGAEEEGQRWWGREGLEKRDSWGMRVEKEGEDDVGRGGGKRVEGGREGGRDCKVTA